MLDSIPGVDPARKKRIIEVLDINPEWRMHQVSDGQRRRVQLAYGLMTPYSVLLLDEITVDLDVLGRVSHPCPLPQTRSPLAVKPVPSE